MRYALTCAVFMSLTCNSMAQGTPPQQATPGNVEVHFDHPDKFRDASLENRGYERGADAQVIKALSEHLQTLAQRYLPPGQQLRIEIRDIDLAGRYEPWNSQAFDVRFMREITWPTIDLSYTLSQPGRPDQQADERVSDKMYLSRPGRQASNDRLYAEKAMLATGFANVSHNARPPEPTLVKAYCQVVCSPLVSTKDGHL